jgi:aryl-alcohol dehydrogenase-like predicted oxidoreductase
MGAWADRLGLGTWQIGGGWGEEPTEPEAIITTARDRGIRWFDTASNYGWGRAEALVGDVLEDPKAIVSTKIGFSRGPAELYRFRRRGFDDVWQDFTPAHLDRELEASLHRLGDCRRVVLLHCPSADQLRSPQLQGWMAGRIREFPDLRFGLSLVTLEEAGVALDEWPSLDCVQLPYSYLNPSFEPSIERFADRGTTVIARVVLASGLLSDEEIARPFPESDHRSYGLVHETFCGVDRHDPEIAAQVADMQAAAGRMGLPTAALAVGWVLSNPAVDIALVGMSRPSQARLFTTVDSHADDLESAARALRQAAPMRAHDRIGG